MIHLALAFALVQAPSAPPASGATGPVIRTDFAVRSRALPYPDAMRPMVARYRECVFPSGRVPHEDGVSRVEAMRNRLTQCGGVRSDEMSRSINGFRSDRAARRSQVRTIFDSLDEDFVANARFIDRLVAGEVSLPAPGAPVDLPKEDDAED